MSTFWNIGYDSELRKCGTIVVFNFCVAYWYAQGFKDLVAECFPCSLDRLLALTCWMPYSVGISPGNWWAAADSMFKYVIYRFLAGNIENFHGFLRLDSCTPTPPCISRKYDLG